jgi:phosphate transport system permease protein
MQNSSNIRLRIIKDRLFLALVVLLSFAMIVPLLLIIFHIVKNGMGVISWEFLTSMPRPMGESGGGIANALAGTMMLIVLASLIAIPLGVLAGIYLVEEKKGPIASGVRMCMEVLQGIPSIVIGIVAYAWVVLSMGTFSALSGSVALAIMMLPVIVRSTEETLRLVPDILREASLALGVSYSRTVLKIVVPSGFTGILTGILLAIARITGETAPLLFTAFGNPYMSLNVLKPVDSLPLMIFNYATSPYPEWHAKAWGAALVLVVFVLGMNFIAKVIAKRWKVQF